MKKRIIDLLAKYKRAVLKTVFYLLLIPVILGTIFAVAYPEWAYEIARSALDFRPRPPYLPLEVPFTVNKAPHTTTMYFIPERVDNAVGVYLVYEHNNQINKMHKLLKGPTYRTDPATGRSIRKKMMTPQYLRHFWLRPAAL